MQKNLTDWQLAQAFPECRNLAISIAYHLEKELQVYDEWIAKHEFNRNFMLIDPRWHNLQRLRKFIKLTKPHKNGQELDIEKAKLVPIQELYDFEQARETNGRIVALCPFHVERSGSFMIYKKQNKFFCFGCRASGDSIEFIMKLKGLNFVEAVKYLGGPNAGH